MEPAPPKGKKSWTITLHEWFTNALPIQIFRTEQSESIITSHAIFFLDTSLRNIIDKLAEFVARNGPEFETITKAKQQSNPRFSFLFGGEFYQYYQWRVSTEQTSK